MDMKKGDNVVLTQNLEFSLKHDNKFLVKRVDIFFEKGTMAVIHRLSGGGYQDVTIKIQHYLFVIDRNAIKKIDETK